ncbi:MAG: ABC transporter permease [Bacteroidota bacterium]|nr:ABC transporter permease [Bacteroidota bacterium]
MEKQRLLYNLNNAFEAFLVNRVRSFLTALGIIFGVAAVISMLAIGNGARQEILDQIKMVGVNNIIVQPLEVNTTQDDANSSNNSNQQQQAASDNKAASSEKDKSNSTFSPGLTLEDAESIRAIIPTVLRVSPEITYNVDFVQQGTKGDGKLTGVTNEYFKVFNIGLSKGSMFTDTDIAKGSPVCIIGPSIESRFFNKGNAIGSFLRCGGVWFKVIGVIKQQVIHTTQKNKLGITDSEKTVFIPLKAILLRFLDRSFTDIGTIRGGGGYRVTGSRAAQMILNMNFKPNSGDEKSNDQIDKIVVQVKESSQLGPTNEVLTKMLKRRHGNNEDVDIKVPELLLKQEQRTKDIFNIVLGAIAGISLIVGGIGIMNIMLASVMERTKEIGIRMGIGARRSDIVMQFISEAMIISVIGGLIGILLGILIAKIITQFTGIQTIVSLSSIAISFGVSASIGIIFGYMPARRAAMQDPVSSLRYE